MSNIGTILYIIMIYIVLIILERIWTCLVKKCERSRTRYTKLKNFLYWTAINTLAMEVYLDVGLAATLNVHTMQWLDNNPDLYMTNIFAILCLVYIVVYTIWLPIFYTLRRPQWKDEEF